MKRAAFWFVMGVVALAWVSSSVRIRGSHDTSVRVERGGPKVVIENGRVHVLGRGKVLDVNKHGVVIAYRDDQDDRDRDGDRVTVEGLPVPVVPGSVVTEAKPEPPAPPRPPRPPQPP